MKDLRKENARMLAERESEANMQTDAAQEVAKKAVARFY